MEEKIIVKGILQRNRLFKILLGIGIVTILLGLIYCGDRFHNGMIYYSNRYWTYETKGFTYFELLGQTLIFCEEIGVGLIIYLGIIIILLSIFLNHMMSKCEITVTDKRVIGKVNFGKRVDLPLNQISAVAQGIFSSIAVATSSGSIHFWCIENRDEVFDELSNLIRNFQIQKTDVNNVEKSVIQQVSNADELKKYKELLDSGVISQEEFDAKKKQLLGL